MKKSHSPSRASIKLLKTLLKSYKRHYDLQIVELGNEIQMLRDELASKSQSVHAAW